MWLARWTVAAVLCASLILSGTGLVARGDHTSGHTVKVTDAGDSAIANMEVPVKTSQPSGPDGSPASGQKSRPLTTTEQLVQEAMDVLCVAASYIPMCAAAPAAPGGAPQPPTTTQIVQTATATITLPKSNPIIEPGPHRNQWNMVAVGYPLWLHVDDTTQLSDSASVAGYTITLSATRQSVRFAMGDGSSVSCTTTTPWDHNLKANPSPTCGYTYAKKSPASGYTVTATSTWLVTWTGAGQSGSFTMEQTGSTTLVVGELVTVLVR